MTRWFTSDLHFSHANIIKFCDRPFKDADEMNRKIVSNINELVSQGDELWILGDLAMGFLENSLPIVKRIHAKKILVGGNHDRFHPYYGKKSEAFVQTYLDKTGAERIIPTNTELTLLDGSNVLVSHFPYPEKDFRPQVSRSGKINTKDKFAEYRPNDNGRWLLCGHVHEKWAVQGRQINVGIDAWGGKPVPEETLVELIANNVSDKPRIIWE